MLEKCLLSVEAHLQDVNGEIFVVDNDSTDGSEQMVHENFPQVHLIENTENVGFAKANNQAIRLSQGKYVLLLNSDAFLMPNSIQDMINVMDSDPSIGIAGACLEYPDGRSQVSYGPLPSYWSEVYSLFGLDKLQKIQIKHSAYEETGMVNGACMLIRTSLFDKIGLLDETFFMFNEEVDLCHRCHKAGLKVVFVPSAKIIHAHAGSTGQTVQRIVRLYSAKLQYFYKHFGPNVESRLKRMMLIASVIKGFVYRLLRVISLGRIRKDDFWWDVSKELSSMFR